ncbi:MAG TPA: hypothetical protein VI893_08280 [Thermoplasmata archaeon]|nr:hypothetical protein [Thermoplasmata archaeon]
MVKRLTLDLPDPLWEWVDGRAQEESLLADEFIRDVLRAVMEAELAEGDVDAVPTEEESPDEAEDTAEDDEDSDEEAEDGDDATDDQDAEEVVEKKPKDDSEVE